MTGASSSAFQMCNVIALTIENSRHDSAASDISTLSYASYILLPCTEPESHIGSYSGLYVPKSGPRHI